MTETLIRSADLRSEVRGNTLHTFGTYADLGAYVETFAPGAFDAALQSPTADVRAYYQHDPAMLLGRQSSGTPPCGPTPQVWASP